MARFKDITGQKFGRLTVIANAGSNRRGKRLWLCRCDCGKETTCEGVNLRNGNSSSCGCIRLAKSIVATRSANRGNNYRKKHGYANNHPLYETWKQMRRRCYGENSTSFKYYGARGIQVCSRWDSFDLFLEDVGPKPSPQHSLDRIDADGNYEPSNVRWATPYEQIHNRRNSKFRQTAKSLVPS